MSDGSIRSNMDNKKEIILKAAIKVFASQGFFGARTREIAKAANLSEGTIYNYFENKEDLLKEIFESIWKNLIPELESKMKMIKNPDDRVDHLLTTTLNLFDTNRELAKVFLIELKKSKTLMMDSGYRLIQDIVRLIRGVLVEGMELGVYRKDLDLNIEPLILYGSVEGILTWWALDDKEVPDFSLKQAKDVLMKGYFRLVR